MNADHLIAWLVAVELATLALAWLVARLSSDRIRRRPHRPRPRIVAPLALAVAALVPAAARAGDTSDDMSGRRELLMAHCPSAVPGALTQVADIPGGVAVAVRAAPGDAIALADIRRRVQYQLEIADRPERGAIEHTGLGTGSGRYGFCPGMVAHTSLAVDWTPDGARMLIRAERAADVPRLRASTRKRARILLHTLRPTASR